MSGESNKGKVLEAFVKDEKPSLFVKYKDRWCEVIGVEGVEVPRHGTTLLRSGCRLILHGEERVFVTPASEFTRDPLLRYRK